MQGKEHPTHIDSEVGLQSVNTHGTEITPGSDEVGIDAQGQLGHSLSDAVGDWFA